MSKDPSPSKGLIDGIDANDSSRSELIDAIEILKEEIESLNLKLIEQEKMLKKENSIIKEEFDGSDDIEILKEMIISQRTAFNEKDKELESLKEKIRILDDYKKDDEELNNLKSQMKDAKSKIDKLTNELEIYKTNEENAKELIIKLNEEKKEYEENEKETLSFIEELSEKKEKYKNKVKILEKKLGDIVNASASDKSYLINDYESEKEGLLAKNVNYVNKINELQNLVENFNEKEKNYEKRIKELEERMDFVKISAIEEVSKYDDEHEKLVDDYEHKLKHLDDKIKNMEYSFSEIKTSLEAENNKYKKRIIELQKLIRTGDQDELKSKSKLELEDEKSLEIFNEIEPELEGKKKPRILTEREEIYAREGDTNDEVIFIEQSDSEAESITRNNEESTPFGGITKIEPIIDSVRKCPKCGNQKKSLIREELDKTNIILAYPRMYGKKYVCGAFGCGCNWRIKNKKIEIL